MGVIPSKYWADHSNNNLCAHTLIIYHMVIVHLQYWYCRYFKDHFCWLFLMKHVMLHYSAFRTNDCYSQLVVSQLPLFSPEHSWWQRASFEIFWKIFKVKKGHTHKVLGPDQFFNKIFNCMSAGRKANAYWGLHFTKEIASKTTAF